MKLGTLTLNRHDLLDQLILSAEHGSRLPTGYVIVDNGGTYDINRARAIIKERVEIDFIRPTENTGVSSGWNIILEKSLNNGDSGIVISNDDIVLGKETFGQIEDGLKGFPFVGCAGGWALFGQSSECTKKVGWYDENFLNAYYEDCDYLLRLRENKISILDLGWGSGVTHSGESSTKGATPKQLRLISECRAHNYAYFVLKWGSNSPRWGNAHVENYPQAFNGQRPPGWKERLMESGTRSEDLIVMRWDVVNAIAEMIGAKRYLEIGVASGEMIQKINIAEKWGVDPTPTLPAVQSSHVFVPSTSDSFFERNLNQSAKFDLVFIDGDHTADQVYREVKNSIKNLSEHGVICLHDCSPHTKEMQEVPLRSGWAWTGDVWKAIARLRAEREHLVRVINSDYGVGIILPKGRPDPMGALPELTWESLQEHRQELLGLLQPWEWKKWFTENYKAAGR